MRCLICRQLLAILDIVHDGNGDYVIIDLNLTAHVGTDPMDRHIIEWLTQGLTDRIHESR